MKRTMVNVAFELWGDLFHHRNICLIIITFLFIDMHINIKLIEEEVQMDAACLVGIAEVKRRMLQQLPDILNVPRNV